VRLLLVFQDNLFVKVPGVRADFFSTGGSFTSGTEAQRITPSNVGLLAAIWRLFTRQYDWVLLPAVDLDWPWDKSPTKNRIRRLVKSLIRSKLISSALRLVWPKQVRVAILDRYDTWKPFLAGGRFFSARLYFKGHYVPAETPPEPKMTYERLPWWVFPENYRHDTPWPKRKYDLFVAMSLSSDIRREARDMAKSFQRDGLTVFAPENSLTFGEYTNALADSRFVLAPEGTGYCCFRHYEAMLSGAVPIVNENTKGYELDLVDGENCIFYRPGDREALLRRLQSLLCGQTLEGLPNRAREFALANNTQEAVGIYLVSKLSNFEAAGRSTRSKSRPATTNGTCESGAPPAR
jgi:hypothetical protein